VLLLGSGELGKEVAIELQRFAVEVIAVDRYANAPAMQIAHRSHVIDMLDGDALRALIEQEKPDLVVPEIEAIHTPTLIELEKEGLHVIPTARAAWLTMDREGIRRLAAEELKLPTSPYRFCDDEAQYREAVAAIGLSVRDQAGDEFVGQGPECGEARRTNCSTRGITRSPAAVQAKGAGDRRGLCGLRL
jgi:phosphoribosylglycinamide formyltransferase 2